MSSPVEGSHAQATLRAGELWRNASREAAKVAPSRAVSSGDDVRRALWLLALNPTSFATAANASILAHGLTSDDPFAARIARCHLRAASPPADIEAVRNELAVMSDGASALPERVLDAILVIPRRRIPESRHAQLSRSAPDGPEGSGDAAAAAGRLDSAIAELEEALSTFPAAAGPEDFTGLQWGESAVFRALGLVAPELIRPIVARLAFHAADAARAWESARDLLFALPARIVAAELGTAAVVESALKSRQGGVPGRLGGEDLDADGIERLVGLLWDLNLPAAVDHIRDWCERSDDDAARSFVADWQQIVQARVKLAIAPER